MAHGTIFLAVIEAYNVQGSQAETLYYGTEGFTTASGDTPAHTYFEPRIINPAILRRDMFGGGTFGRSRVSVGELRLANPDGGLDYLLDYGFDGRPITVYYGDLDDAFPGGFTVVFAGTMQQVESTRTELRVKLRDKQADLDVQIQQTLYAGDNVLPAGLEGGAELAGKPKPLVFGSVRNVPAVLVNSAKLIYQVADGDAGDIPVVRDELVSLGQTPVSWSALDNGVDTTDFRSVACKDADVIVAGGTLGKLRRSADGGVSFVDATSDPFNSAAASPAPSLVDVGSVDGEVSGAANKLYSTIEVTDNDNRMMLGFIALRRVPSDDEHINLVKSDVDGAFTKLQVLEDTTNGHARAEVWYLANPSLGTHVVEFRLNASKTARFVVSTAVFDNVDPADPFDPDNEADGNSTGPATVDVTSAASTQLVVDVLAKKDNTEAITVGSGQTEVFNAETVHGTTANNIQLGVSTEAGASTVTMSWTWPSGTRLWSIIGVPLKGVPSQLPEVSAMVYDPDSDSVIAGTTDGQLAYSTDDGDTWTAITGGSNPWYSPAERINALAVDDSGVIIGVGADGTVGRSTNGTTFAAVSTPLSAEDVTAVTWGSLLRRWAIVAADSQTIITSSDDGVTWTAHGIELPTELPPVGLAYGLGFYVLLHGSASQSALAVSVDAFNYTLVYESPELGGNGIAFGGTMQQFIVAGQHVDTTHGHVLTSHDALQWYLRTSTLVDTNIARAVAANGTQIVVAADNGNLERPDTSGTYVNQTDLLDDSMAPSPGTFKAYPGGGYFRLGSNPAGVVTADVVQGAAASDRTAAQLWTDVLTKCGKTSADWSTSDVSALDALNAAECGVWVGPEERLCSTLLSFLAQSVGAWWGPDRTGVYRIKRLGSPAEGASTVSFVEDDIRDLARIAVQDEHGGLPVYEVLIRYNRNYSPLEGTQVAGGVSTADRADYAKAWHEVASTDTSIQTAHPKAQRIRLETALVATADAVAEALRQRTLRDQITHRFVAPVMLDATSLAVDLGDIATVTHSRFGLSAGGQVAVIGIEPDGPARMIRLGLWYLPRNYHSLAIGLGTASASLGRKSPHTTSAAGSAAATVTLVKV